VDGPGHFVEDLIGVFPRDRAFSGKNMVQVGLGNTEAKSKLPFCK
jgi:hypothetical protein